MKLTLVQAEPQDKGPERATKQAEGGAKANGAPRHTAEAQVTPSFETMDRVGRAVLARFTQGISPHALYDAWASHLAGAPGRLLQLGIEGAGIGARLAGFAARSQIEQTEPPFKPQVGDRRFDDPAWQLLPYVLWQQAFLAQELWWQKATRPVRGMTPKSAARIGFITRQLLDVWSPSNIPWLNPLIIERTAAESGANLWRGAAHLQEDIWRALTLEPKPEADRFKVGEDIAVTPGEVVYRNDLMELIQYKPATREVVAEPVLIVPAWIMKYYVLDLSPHNSLVRYLVERGFTVFMISWRNPTAKDRDLAFDAYRTRGIMAALDAVNAVVPERKVHAVGYCIGGTLLAIAAATMAREDDDRGHNAGIVSEPGHRGRRYRMVTRQCGDRYIDSDTWLTRASEAEGSWWPAWVSWLAERSDAERVPPPGIGAPSRGLVPLAKAPGVYVYQR